MLTITNTATVRSFEAMFDKFNFLLTSCPRSYSSSNRTRCWTYISCFSSQ